MFDNPLKLNQNYDMTMKAGHLLPAFIVSLIFDKPL